MGERSVRIREVKGSNPSGSTINPHRVVVGIFIFTIRLHKFLKAALHKIYKTGSRQNACCRFCVLTFGESIVIIRTVLNRSIVREVLRLVPILSYAQHYKKYYTVQFEGAAAAYGLNQLEIDILLFLHNNPELCTASDICRYRALAKSNVSAAVERLRSRGVLTVSPAPGNRRQRLLAFTADGQRIAAALAEIQHRTVEPLFEGFTAEEQQRLQEYLSRIDANIQRQLKKE